MHRSYNHDALLIKEIIPLKIKVMNIDDIATAILETFDKNHGPITTAHICKIKAKAINKIAGDILSKDA